MSRSERDEAVKKFNKSPKYKCLLMSLKAGGRIQTILYHTNADLCSLKGVGLNLTGGNRVILLDLAWSPAVEGQGRSHGLYHIFHSSTPADGVYKPSIDYIGWARPKRYL